MNVDDPKLTAYALNELDEPERSVIARSIADSPEVQQFVGETQELARALRAQYHLKLQRDSMRPGTLTAIEDDGFWSKAGPLAIAALVAISAVIGAVVISNHELQISVPPRSNLAPDLGQTRVQPNQVAPVEAEDIAGLNQKEQLEADAGPYAFTGERPFVSVVSRPRSSVPLIVNSGSYLDFRRSINNGQLPSRESLRIEGMINYFSYEYPQPSPGQSFSLNLDVVTCPWETTHRLVRIGIKGDQQVAVRTDTRVEIEFNPQRVASYRLIGYDRQENDAQGLKNENVGVHEVPAGYALTTFYEVVPSNRVWTAANTQMPGAAGEKSEPMLIAKLELDRTGKNAGLKIIQRTGTDTGSDFAAAPADLKFGAAVAEFGMIVRGSEYKGKASLEDVIEWARQGMGADATGSRADFIQLVRKTQTLKKS